MVDLIHEGSTKTPSIHFNASTGKLEMKGRSIPEIATEFFQPVFDWMTQYASEPHPETYVNVMFEYFNTSSSKCILDFFKQLEDIHYSGKTKVMINWQYNEEDESMYEAGQEYQTIVDVPFQLTEIGA